MQEIIEDTSSNQLLIALESKYKKIGFKDVCTYRLYMQS